MDLSKFLLAWLAMSASAGVSAQGGADAMIDRAVTPLSDALSAAIFYEIPIPFIDQGIPFIVLWLVFAALFFTFYFGFINLRAMKHAFRLVRGDYTPPEAAGEVTHFQALATALSGTVGLGNIAGVALAVSLGGPGATFWMVMAGLFSMSTKFAECTLGVKYRNEYADGTVSGGPMYYLSKGLAEEWPALAGVGKVLAIVFSIFCIGASAGAGTMFQTNQAFSQLVNVTGGADSPLGGFGWLFGLVVALLVGLVIIGGIKSIARVTEKIVPFMAVVYVSAGLLIIGLNINLLPAAFGAIISGAFQPEGIYGGFVGVLIMGFRRAAFSNEAGVGSAAIAHSAVRTDRPVTEGLVALYEPFIDTVVVCTLTALVIIITGSLDPTGQIAGVELTSRAFGSVIDWFPLVLLLAVLLFAFSTVISWSYYGLKAFTYLFGEGRRTELIFKAMVLVAVVLGSSINLTSVMNFADAMILAMSVPNLIGVYLLTPVVKRELTAYWSDYKAGRLKTYR